MRIGDMVRVQPPQVAGLQSALQVGRLDGTLAFGPMWLVHRCPLGGSAPESGEMGFVHPFRSWRKSKQKG